MTEVSSQQPEREALVEALEEAFRPLMALALAYGVTQVDLLDVVRSLYVTTLRDRLTTQGRPATTARLALMAGLTRGEVEKVLASTTGKTQRRTQSAEKVDRLAFVLSTWTSDPRFSTPYGAPLELSLQRERGYRALDDLIEVACPGMDRDVIIDELLAAGCIELHEDKFVRCITRTFVPSGMDVSRIARLGRYVGALNSTFAHNLLRERDEPAYFERTIVSDFFMSKEGRNGLIEHLRQDGQDFLDRTDRWIAEQEPRWADSKGTRYGMTLFFYEETSATEHLENKVLLAEQRPGRAERQS